MEQVPKTCLAPSSVELALVEAGRRLDADELHRHWVQMRYQADQGAGLEAEEEQRRRRWLRLTETRWGSFRLEGELDAEGGVTLRTALRRLMGRRPAGDERTPEQRRADAIAELARRQLDSGELPERGGERPHLLLIADEATMRREPGSRMAQLDWKGPLVTGETARRIACDASVTRVTVGPDGEVLRVGRRSRTIPAPTRRALNLRDRHCQGPGCEMPADLCTPHHRVHRADGGSDELDNLELRCDHCHGLLHPENARFRRGATGPGASQSRAP
jgi:hypothetical protein